MTKQTISTIQSILKVKPDGIWGPKSQAALNTEIKRTADSENPKLKKIRELLGVEKNLYWDIGSQEALNTVISESKGFKAEASSFADPADVTAFNRCKTQGKTDQQCFRVGDNGIGQFGKITAQTHTPMVAIHAEDMKAKWGSVNAAAHRTVKVTINGKSVEATVEDRLGVKGRIDLNPACAKVLGLNPPFLKNCVWQWI